jgi:hypothetical protein
MTTKTRLSLLNLYKTNTGKTTHTPIELADPAKLTAYFRDRTDMSSVPDVRRWR